jgi:hypothetical protein
MMVNTASQGDPSLQEERTHLQVKQLCQQIRYSLIEYETGNL